MKQKLWDKPILSKHLSKKVTNTTTVEVQCLKVKDTEHD